MSKFRIEIGHIYSKETDHFLVEKVIPYFVVCSQHVNISFLGIMPRILLYESVRAMVVFQATVLLKSVLL